MAFNERHHARLPRHYKKPGAPSFHFFLIFLFLVPSGKNFMPRPHMVFAELVRTRPEVGSRAVKLIIINQKDTKRATPKISL